MRGAADVQVPLLTEQNIDHIPNNSLCRFQGMVSHSRMKIEQSDLSFALPVHQPLTPVGLLRSKI